MSLSHARHAAFVEFRKSVLASLFPYLRRRTTPCYIVFNGIRLDARLQGGNEIRLLLCQMHQEPLGSLHFVIDIRKADLVAKDRTVDPQMMDHETHLLNTFALGINGLVAHGSLSRAIHNAPLFV